MKHSIIIPHRNRNREVYQACFSIEDSARRAGITDYEIIIVDDGLQSPVRPQRGRVHELPIGFRTDVLNKPRVLNYGIACAKGDILSFIDADMLVGPDWMAGVQASLGGPQPPTRLCFRVRQLKLCGFDHLNTKLVLAKLDPIKTRARLLQEWFEYERYKQFVLAFEAYGEPEAGDKPRKGEDGEVIKTPVFGNSQFSIRRDVLGYLRFNENLEGAGYEDIWMAWAIWKRYGSRYQGAIYTEGRFAMLHIWHGSRSNQPDMEGDDWAPPDVNSRNQSLYYADKMGIKAF